MKDDKLIWDLLAETVKRWSLRCRIKARGLEVSAWDSPLLQPSDSYVELPCLGPVRKPDVEWMEIDPVETKRQGRFAGEKRIDHSDDVLSVLKGLACKISVADGGIIVTV